MTYNSRVILVLTIIVLSSCTTNSRTMARPLLNSSSTLAARLKLDDDDDGSSLNCWDSLGQLQACTGEILLFFFNGETYLGHGCCEAINAIGHQCWPDLIDVLGFTSEEGDILEGYCDASDHDNNNSATPSNTEAVAAAITPTLVP